MTAERSTQATQSVQLKLDRRTLRHIKELAAARNCTVEQFLQNLVAGLEKPDPLLGLFRDAPEVLDQVVQDAMRDRETRPLRLARE
jgi:hypothetical protein